MSQQAVYSKIQVCNVIILIRKTFTQHGKIIVLRKNLLWYVNKKLYKNEMYVTSLNIIIWSVVKILMLSE